MVEAPFGEEEERPEEEELIREEKPEEEKKEEAPKAEEEELEELVEESVEEEEERPPSVKELVAETGDLLKELARLGQGTVVSWARGLWEGVADLEVLTGCLV